MLSVTHLCMKCSSHAVSKAYLCRKRYAAQSSLLFLFYICCFLAHLQAHSLHGLLTHRHITAARDRSQPLVLNLCLALPAGFRTVTLSAQFSKAFLTIAEYPPDAHRGFDVPAAKITFGVTDLQSSGNCPGQQGSSSSSQSWHVRSANRAQQQQEQEQQLPLLQALAAARPLQVRCR
jgi:hypothetical protein